jgi:hypothetical protein
MKTTQSFRIHFTIRADKEKDGKSPIYACITVNSKSAFSPLSKASIQKPGLTAKGCQKEAKRSPERFPLI